MSPQAWHTLSAVLSFTSRDGSRHFTVEQLATAIGQPRAEAGRRLSALAQTLWKSDPLVTLEHNSGGEVCGASVAPVERLAVPTISPTIEATNSGATISTELTKQLSTLGLNPTQIASLAQRFPEADLQRQLKWLPARGARNPAALYIRAVEQQWEEPKDGR